MKKINILLIITFIIFIACYFFINVSHNEKSSKYVIDTSAKSLSITKSAKDAFAKATKDYVGMSFNPIALLGTRKEDNEYAFLVKSKTKSDKKETNWKVITINVNEKGISEVQSINDITIENYTTNDLQSYDDDNSWDINAKSGMQKLESDIKNNFNNLNFDNATYKPIALLGTKEDIGIDYAILCLAKYENKSYSLEVVVMNVYGNKSTIKTINKFKLSEFN